MNKNINVINNEECPFCYSNESMNNQILFNNNNILYICDKCADKLVELIKYDTIYNKDKGKLLDDLVNHYFRYVYDKFENDIDIWYQPTIEEIRDEYIIDNEYKQLRKAIDNLSDDDIKDIEVIWNYLNKTYYSMYKEELNYRSACEHGHSKAGPIEEEELQEYIKLLKENK